jgi:hypothetical protein
MNVTLVLALVHNNNEARNCYIRPSLEALSQEIGHDYDVKKIEVSFQDAIIPHSFWMAFTRDLIYFKLSCQWHLYCLLNPFRSLLELMGLFKRSFLKYIFSRSTLGRRWVRNSAIEAAVTDKHIRAWTEFLDTNADWLICFEDDAVFKEDSIENVKKLLTQVGSSNGDTYSYFDLAGGCNLNDLRIDKLLERKDNYFRYYTKPVTNTACVYMVNRSLVSKFHGILTRKPWLRLVGIDWMMNSLFVLIGEEHSNWTPVCMHASPTFFKHGTTTGDYVSWQAV